MVGETRREVGSPAAMRRRQGSHGEQIDRHIPHRPHLHAQKAKGDHHDGCPITKEGAQQGDDGAPEHQSRRYVDQYEGCQRHRFDGIPHPPVVTAEQACNLNQPGRKQNG